MPLATGGKTKAAKTGSEVLGSSPGMTLKAKTPVRVIIKSKTNQKAVAIKIPR